MKGNREIFIEFLELKEKLKELESYRNNKGIDDKWWNGLQWLVDYAGDIVQGIETNDKNKQGIKICEISKRLKALVYCKDVLGISDAWWNKYQELINFSNRKEVTNTIVEKLPPKWIDFLKKQMEGYSTHSLTEYDEIEFDKLLQEDNFKYAETVNIWLKQNQCYCRPCSNYCGMCFCLRHHLHIYYNDFLIDDSIQNADLL